VVRLAEDVFSGSFLYFHPQKMSKVIFCGAFLTFIVLISCTRENNKDKQGGIIQEDSLPEMNKNNFDYTYLALGDSYTIGESVENDERFPVQLAEKLIKNGFLFDSPEIVAQTGWTTDELAAAIGKRELDEKYDLVTLLIGVNNQFRGRDSGEYRIQFAELLQTAIGFADEEKRVIVVSIPDYGVTPFGRDRNPEKIAREIDLFNRINFEETQKTNARYINITGISRQAETNAELIASDGLHPSGEMYRMWVEVIFLVAKQILENNN
jgi:lysophospholipase L1-like esterase